MPDGTYMIFKPENMRYLGVWFHDNFSFTDHIDIPTCKIGQILAGKLWKRHHLNFEAKRLYITV